MKIVFALALSILSLYASSQGSISGQITDSKTNETIPGVKIMLEGKQKGAYSDLDGNYTFMELEAGFYTLSFKYDTYTLQLIENVEVKSGEITELNVSLVSEILQIGPVEVSYTVNKESNSELIRMQRNSASVVDGISADLIKKTPDSKASDVLKRVSGASVQDNKFVVIRGLNDRYNFALLNGASLPSTESDRKAFSFDLFPSNMLDNLMIFKTATPDLPGEFAGGVIDINTKEPKDENFQTIQLSGSYHSITTFKNFERSEGGKLDILGFGASDRSLPDGIPTTADFPTSKAEKAELAKLMNFSWASRSSIALPNTSFQYAIGRNIKIKDKKLGVVLAYNYNNSNQFNQQIRRDYEEQASGTIMKMELEDSMFTKSIVNSAMLNLQYKLNNKNSLSFKNLYTVNSEDKVNIRHGVRELDNDPHQYERSVNFMYLQNNLFTSQILGDHEIGKGNLNWTGGFSDITRQIPNQRRVVYRKYAMAEDDPNEYYAAVIQSNGTIPTAAGNMFWSTSNEKIGSLKYDYSYAFGDVKDSNRVTLKMGGMNQIRSREFSARNFGFSQYKPSGGSFNSQLLLLSEDEIFSPENLGLIGTDRGGFKLEEASKVDDSYSASSFLNAGFVMADATLLGKLRMIGGVRFESYQQQFQYIEFGTNEQRNLDTTVNDLLPSVNFVYALNKKMNLRASYYRTLSRPEFRELAPFAFYNFIMDNILTGNPSLKRATIDNLDLRYEFFPGNGQVLSFSGFYKHFTNPIELINRTGTSGAPELFYTNVPSAMNVGGELEYRLNMGFLSKKKENSFWNGLTLYTNVSYIRSQVQLDDFAGTSNRPLQGQSPYIINTGAYFNSKDTSWLISASFNRVGQRIYIVGNVQEPNVWENGRNVLDLQIAKRVGNHWEFKMNIRDLLAQDLIFFQDLNGNGKFDNKVNKNRFKSNDPTTDNKYEAGPDNVWQEVTNGQTISLQIKYNF
jgi:outer membrane receptor protein involved in Fe transport